MVTIVQKEDPVLRAKAAEVPVKDITSPKIAKVIAAMKAALGTQHDGVAIAAPQIGHSYRIFVVSGKIFHKDWKRGEGLAPDEKDVPADIVFINPTVTKMSKEKKWLPEGCLSVRPLWGEVRRSIHASVKAYDETGKAFTRGASGLLAQIFQHETDHLDGVLFIDRARNVEVGPDGSK